jgi:hypothetical protein
MSELATQRLLERYLAGELPADEASQLEARLPAEPRLAQRLAALREDDARALAGHPPEVVAREIGRRLRIEAFGAAMRKRRRRFDPGPMIWLVPAPIALAVLLAVVRQGGGTSPAQEPDEIRTKGLEPHLNVYLAGGPAPVLLKAGARVKGHDVVQVAVVAPGRLWACVVSVDAQGGATLHAPPAPVGNGELRLPSSFELDEAPGFERFFLVYGGGPFDERTILEAARALARDPAAARSSPLSLPAGLSQSDLLLDKVTP